MCATVFSRLFPNIKQGLNTPKVSLEKSLACEICCQCFKCYFIKSLKLGNGVSKKISKPFHALIWRWGWRGILMASFGAADRHTPRCLILYALSRALPSVGVKHCITAVCSRRQTHEKTGPCARRGFPRNAAPTAPGPGTARSERPVTERTRRWCSFFLLTLICLRSKYCKVPKLYIPICCAFTLKWYRLNINCLGGVCQFYFHTNWPQKTNLSL